MLIKSKEEKVERKGVEKTVFENTYRCDWCGYTFEMTVRNFEGSGKHSVSDQIKCRHCGAFIKTWS